MVECVELSEALFGDKNNAIAEMMELVSECREENWDGYDAMPISLRTMDQTSRFIKAIPDGLPMPEFAPEPDGAISLDWIQSKTRVFSVSIGESDRLAYAWLDGTDKGHAVARFDEGCIPKRIFDGICEIIEG